MLWRDWNLRLDVICGILLCEPLFTNTCFDSLESKRSNLSLSLFTSCVIHHQLSLWVYPFHFMPFVWQGNRCDRASERERERERDVLANFSQLYLLDDDFVWRELLDFSLIIHGKSKSERERCICQSIDASCFHSCTENKSLALEISRWFAWSMRRITNSAKQSNSSALVLSKSADKII